MRKWNKSRMKMLIIICLCTLVCRLHILIPMHWTNIFRGTSKLLVNEFEFTFYSGIDLEYIFWIVEYSVIWCLHYIISFGIVLCLVFRNSKQIFFIEEEVWHVNVPLIFVAWNLYIISLLLGMIPLILICWRVILSNILVQLLVFVTWNSHVMY